MRGEVDARALADGWPRGRRGASASDRSIGIGGAVGGREREGAIDEYGDDRRGGREGERKEGGKEQIPSGESAVVPFAASAIMQHFLPASIATHFS